MPYVKFLLSTLVNIFVAPAGAYRNLRDKPSSWFPLLVLVLTWVVLWNWFYHTVDYAWLLDHLIGAETTGVPAGERTTIAENISGLKPGALIVISIFVTIAVLLVSTLVMSMYLLIVAAVYDDKPGFKDWFSFTLWASMTGLLAVVIMAINFQLNENRQVAPDQLNPLTLNNLFFHVGNGSPFKRLLDGVDMTLLWSQVIMIVGYREWTMRSWTTSAVIILAPSVVVYGVWMIVAAFY